VLYFWFHKSWFDNCDYSKSWTSEKKPGFHAVHWRVQSVIVLVLNTIQVFVEWLLCDWRNNDSTPSTLRPSAFKGCARFHIYQYYDIPCRGYPNVPLSKEVFIIIVFDFCDILWQRTIIKFPDVKSVVCQFSRDERHTGPRVDHQLAFSLNPQLISSILINSEIIGGGSGWKIQKINSVVISLVNSIT
jgi:hypothetical protein